MAAQDQAITTNCIKVNIFHQSGSTLCRLCGQRVESLNHIYSSCSVITQYKRIHENVARLVHFELAKLGGFHTMDSWWHHCPPPVMENICIKLLWNYHPNGLPSAS